MFSSFSDYLLYSSVVFIASAILFILHFFIFNKKFKSVYRSKDNKSLIDFSSFVNNIVGPLFAIGGALIIYSTIVKNDEDDKLKHFESVFLKLVEYHRDNNNDMYIRKAPKSGSEIKGKSAFTSFNNQLRKAIRVVRSIDSTINKESVFDLAFQIFYIGTNDTSEKILLKSIIKNTIGEDRSDLLYENCKSIQTYSNKVDYFDGNKTRLSAYFNQYINALSYLDQGTETLHNLDTRFYSNLLNSQNGLYERVLIHLYSISSLATNEEKRLINEYIQFSRIDKVELESMFNTKIELK
jgi:hypothetical protein